MKATFNTKELAIAFGKAAQIARAKTRSPKPILRYVRLDVVGLKATLTATDLERAIQVEVECDPLNGGSCLLDSERMSGILSSYSGDELTIETTEQGIEVTGANKSRWELPTDNVDEFPKASFQLDSPAVVSCAALRDALKRTMFAISSDSQRFALHGVLFDRSEGNLSVVATDGKRMSAVECPASAVVLSDTHDIIPAIAAKSLASALPEEGECKIDFSPNSMVVVCDDVSFYTLLLEGRFPIWRQVLPNRDGGIEVPNAQLLSAIRQVSVVRSEESTGTDFRMEDGTMRLEAVGSPKGAASVEFPVAGSEKANVRLDCEFVADFLRVADETVSVSFAGPDKAVLFTDGEHRYVVMPMAKE